MAMHPLYPIIKTVADSLKQDPETFQILSITPVAEGSVVVVRIYKPKNWEHRMVYVSHLNGVRTNMLCQD